MTIEDIQALIHGDETRTLELKKTTGELKDGIRSVCAFLNTAGGWLFFGIAPTTLKILGQEVTDNTRKEIAREIAKLEPLIDLPVEYIDVPDRPGCQVIAIRIQPECVFCVGHIQKKHHTARPKGTLARARTVQPYNPHNPTS